MLYSAAFIRSRSANSRTSNFQFRWKSVSLLSSTCICLACRERSQGRPALTRVCLQLRNYERRVRKIPVERISVCLSQYLPTNTPKSQCTVCRRSLNFTVDINLHMLFFFYVFVVVFEVLFFFIFDLSQGHCRRARAFSLNLIMVLEPSREIGPRRPRLIKVDCR